MSVDTFQPSPDDIKDFIFDFEDECKIEFIDPRYLSINTLDSDNSALEYFYLSPFYLNHRDKALNEAIRAGKIVDDYQVGIIFKVTYNNLDSLNEEALKFGSNTASRSQFYVMSSIFHITLFSRDLGRTGVETTPIKIYYIIQGSIFMCPPFGSLVRTKLHQYISDFERLYDRLNSISSWSITNGYVWSPKERNVNREIEKLSERYGFNACEDKDYVSDGNMNIFYLKSEDKIGARILQDEVSQVNEELQKLYKVDEAATQ
ncbi:hypothetical protein MACJ_002082 [Theileria orientalis]|uniref:Mediator of RNA polymerase II transcription subunit 6 n=1 Tax=Theileria orientalis TaxID=68886 RepID=A0A976M6Z7_THEOR|nr:hypothetical protein MACJ_002082 [Theileria orientalis]